MPTNIGQKIDVYSSSFAALQHCKKFFFKKERSMDWLLPFPPPSHTPLLRNQSNSNPTSVLWKDWAEISFRMALQGLFSEIPIFWTSLGSYFNICKMISIKMMKVYTNTTEGRVWLVWGPQSCRVESLVCSYNNTGCTKSLFLKGRRYYFYFTSLPFYSFKINTGYVPPITTTMKSKIEVKLFYQLILTTNKSQLNITTDENKA